MSALPTIAEPDHPLCNPLAELSVLSYAALGGDFGKVRAKARDGSYFYSPDNRTAFEVMAALDDAGKPVADTALLLPALEYAGLTPAYIGAIVSGSTGEAYIDADLDELLYWHQKRQLREAAYQFNLAAINGHAPREIISNLRLQLDAIEGASTDMPIPADIERIVSSTAPPPRPLFHNEVMLEALTGINAQGGSSKTFLLAILAISVAIGRALLASFVPTCCSVVVLFVGEDTYDEWHRRIQKIIGAYDLDANEQELLARNLKLFIISKSFPLVELRDDRIVETTNLRWVSRIIEQYQPRWQAPGIWSRRYESLGFMV